MKIYFTWPKSGTTRKAFFIVFMFFFIVHGSDNLKIYLRSIEDLNKPSETCGSIKSYQRVGGIKSKGWYLSLIDESGDIDSFNFNSWHVNNLVANNLLPINGSLCVDYIYIKYSFLTKFITKIYSNDIVYLDSDMAAKAYLSGRGMWPSWVVFLELFLALSFVINIHRGG